MAQEKPMGTDKVTVELPKGIKKALSKLHENLHVPTDFIVDFERTIREALSRERAEADRLKAENQQLLEFHHDAMQQMATRHGVGRVDQRRVSKGEGD